MNTYLVVAHPNHDGLAYAAFVRARDGRNSNQARREAWLAKIAAIAERPAAR